MQTDGKTTHRVMIVEDEAIVQVHLSREVKSLGYEVVGVAASAREAVALANREQPDLILMDIKLRGEADGIEAAIQIGQTCDASVVFLTAYADENTVKRTEKVGALGYIVKPYSRNEVRAVLATAVSVRRHLREAVQKGPPAPRSRASSAGGPFHGMIGQDARMQAVFERIVDVARLDWAVLIAGQTGTGKELTARALHQESKRAAGPFVAVNCAGLTDTLLASQLFGHKRGAFTGAIDDHPGCFEMADGGTLFLDEIADISTAAQMSLLRVLDDGLVQRVGETTSRAVDVWVVSATQRDLAQEVAAGRFRADLLFRLRAVRIDLPLLRDRGQDVPLLAEHFLASAVQQSGLPVTGFAEQAHDVLRDYAWPGNVRELRHAIDHAVLSCRSGLIGPADFPPEMLAPALAASQEFRAEGDELSRIKAALAQSGGNRAEAARLLGISRATLYRRFAELGIDPDGVGTGPRTGDEG